MTPYIYVNVSDAAPQEAAALPKKIPINDFYDDPDDLDIPEDEMDLGSIEELLDPILANSETVSL